MRRSAVVGAGVSRLVLAAFGVMASGASVAAGLLVEDASLVICAWGVFVAAGLLRAALDLPEWAALLALAALAAETALVFPFLGAAWRAGVYAALLVMGATAVAISSRGAGGHRVRRRE